MIFFPQKLPSIFKTIKITQTPHGSQNEKALDLSNIYKLICPVDGCKTSKTIDVGQQRYFNVTLPDSDKSILQIVHAIPTRENSTFRKGEVMGTLVPFINKDGDRADHWHIAIKVKGVWHNFLDYTDRNNKILLGKGVERKWADWNTYKDLTLNLPFDEQAENKDKTFISTDDKKRGKEAVKGSKALSSKKVHTDRLDNNNLDSFIDFISRIDADADIIKETIDTVNKLAKEKESLLEEVDKKQEKINGMKKQIYDLEADLNNSKKEEAISSELKKVAFNQTKQLKKEVEGEKKPFYKSKTILLNIAGALGWITFFLTNPEIVATLPAKGAEFVPMILNILTTIDRSIKKDITL